MEKSYKWHMDEARETSWKFYTSSAEAWDAMLRDLHDAKETIDLEQYIFVGDVVGNKFLEVCKRKAREGVHVRIFCDEIGSFGLSRSDEIESLKEAGVKIRFFNPIMPWNAGAESLWYFRDHRKLLVIDRKIGFTGGACLAEEMRNWRESHVRIEGHVVKEMSHAFNTMWNKEYKKPFFYFQKKKKNVVEPFSYITNSPLPRKRFMYHELVRILKSAKHYIYLTTPYFLPDHRITRLLKAAARRKKVEVRLLVPEHPNHLLVDIGARTFFDEMLRSGVKIFLYKSMIHGKTGVVDGNWSTIGSLNLDNVSLRYNFEANLVSTDTNFAFELEKQFMTDLGSAKELTLSEWRARPFIQKVVEALVWPIRKLL